MYIYYLYEYIYIYVSMLELYFIDIFDISLFFLICQDGYFHTNALHIKFFNNFSLPDVASVFSPLFNIISLVISVGVIVHEDDEANKVEFVLTDVSCEFTETLH